MDIILESHIILSLLGIVCCFWVIAGWFKGVFRGYTTLICLTATFTASLSGFLLPADELRPSHLVGLLSVILLIFAINSLYVEQLQGGWRIIYIISALASFYLNVFVAVVQAFIHIDFLHGLAPTQQELLFVFTQAGVFLFFSATAIITIAKPALPPAI
ncbi:hypothetical protein [Rheinheimera sp.]|uniref:hypothetical protein n=1 Tax=Rheinheimera sp. TaxID=1869214 RepID=UPI00307E5D15